jgi:hypothetical protein
MPGVELGGGPFDAVAQKLKLRESDDDGGSFGEPDGVGVGARGEFAASAADGALDWNGVVPFFVFGMSIDEGDGSAAAVSCGRVVTKSGLDRAAGKKHPTENGIFMVFDEGEDAGWFNEKRRRRCDAARPVVCAITWLRSRFQQRP